MIMHAVLGNPDHLEYGVATIPFPIPKDQYDYCMEMLEALEIGDPHKKDCKVQAIDSFYSVLKITENLRVNLDELDYLARRLESFDVGEAAQFQAMAHKLELFELKDLINLTFCCQQATVITDFSNLEAIGRDHYMNLHGGCANTQELEALDGAETARLLIDSGGGTITPYGVVYSNGMKLEQHYDGQHFPAYLYEPCMLMMALTSRLEPEDTENVTWLYLPAAKGQIERAMARSGIADPENMCFLLAETTLPNEVDAVLNFRQESIYELNDLAAAIEKLSLEDRRKLEAAIIIAEPECASQISQLAENLDLFDFVPDAKTPEDYGRYVIQKSGHFEYDENLEQYYDYARYGQQRMDEEFGEFSDYGYIAYKGFVSLEELMAGIQSERLQMGGLT